MGVFKWLRRERLTVTTGHISPTPSLDPPPQVGTIRTEEYMRDLAEFQARRSSGGREDTPIKKKCGRHSLPVSCTNCTGDPDTTFNYEMKSAIKYKKKSHKRVRSSHSEERLYEGAPNIQFLFQNQVFMPGNKFISYSEPRKANRHHACQRSPDFLVQKHIDFKEDQLLSPPLFYKNNALHIDTDNFLELERTDDEVDGVRAAGDVITSSHGSGSHKNDSCDEKLWEVMSELKHFDKWADEQLQAPSSATKSDDSRSEVSAFGLPIASACNLDLTEERNTTWTPGKWGVVPVLIKRLAGVTIDHVKKKRNMEINILRKFRHPNIILLMGLYPDVQNNIHIVCERCVDTLYGVLHVKGLILSVQTSVHYALDIANALVYLHMQGYLHTALTSRSVMITAQDTAKLADLEPCSKLPKTERYEKGYNQYSPEPQYINLTDNQTSTSETEPLLTQRSDTSTVSKPYTLYSEMEHYQWQAPELFDPDDGVVRPCSRSDVYSLCIILWECCNASIPWKSLSYVRLKQLYTQWRAGIQLAADGSYPGSVLALLQRGLLLDPQRRQPLEELRDELQRAQHDLDEIEYIILPGSKKKTSFSTQPWDTASPTDSECRSPENIQHTAVIHTLHPRDSETDSEKESKSSHNETICRTNLLTSFTTEKCFVSDEEDKALKYDHLKDRDYNSACSTPLAKLRARIKDIESPGTLHRSDSTEYCSIVSPDTRLTHFELNDKEQSTERPTAKLSRSFTPKSYKPLHIKVPEYNLDSIKTILKDQNGNEGSSYNFDIKNYSLPTTPIARSNKLRKNAWLSGDINANRSPAVQKLKDDVITTSPEESETKQSTNTNSTNSPLDKEEESEPLSSYRLVQNEVASCDNNVVRDRITGLRRIPDPPHDFLAENISTLERARSLNCMQSIKYKIEDELLANVNVKPLVAIHERWIYEANKKTGRSMSMPEDNSGSKVHAVKPASHCVDTLQKSLPQLYGGPGKAPRSASKIGGQWEQYSHARDAISKSMTFNPIDTNTYKKAVEKGTITEDIILKEPKVDRSTDTLSIEEFIRDLIRKEFQHMISEMSDNVSEPSRTKSDEFLNKGVANIMESLKNNEDPDSTLKKESIKSYSTIKINGNNKPLLQITFSRSGDNNLQVLDNCVHVSICDSNSGRDKINISMEDNVAGEDIHLNSLKRCQAFSAIQEARSTEDLYIDDDLSTHMQENFGRVKLIPLHGSIHEILCDRDDCCLVKLKQENGCDTIYLRCDTSDTESRDAVDGADGHADTVLYKRSISLVEERIQRVCPPKRHGKKNLTDKLKVRPKSEIFIKSITKDTRSRSNSTPSLSAKDRNDEVELNVENLLCYQDSSSDECLKVGMDDFEALEREIEEDLANSNLTSTCGCLEKISEENLSTITEDLSDRN